MMRKQPRSGLVGRLALLMAAMLFIAACDEGETADNGDRELRVTTWTGSEEHLEVLNGIADSFEEANPRVTVTYETIPFPDYLSRLTVALAGSNPPDLGWIFDRANASFIESSVLVDLGPAVREDAEYAFDDFLEAPMELVTDGDAVYGLPFSTSPFIIFYNADMFESTGLETPDQLAARGEWTWEAVREAAAAIAADTPANVYGFESHDNAVFSNDPWTTLVSLMWAYGAEPWDSDGQCGFDDPAAVEAFELFHGMTFEDGGAVPPGEVADFFTGNSAIRISQISRGPLLEDADFDWDIAPMPSGPAGQVNPVGQAAFAVYTAGENVDLATQFAKHITTAESLQELAAFFPPIRQSVLDSGVLAEANPVFPEGSVDRVVGAALADGRLLPTHAEFPNIDQAARAALDAVWQPDADVAAALTGVCEAIQPILDGS